MNDNPYAAPREVEGPRKDRSAARVRSLRRASWWLFGLAMLLAVSVGLPVVTMHSVKRNPARSAGRLSIGLMAMVLVPAALGALLRTVASKEAAQTSKQRGDRRESEHV